MEDRIRRVLANVRNEKYPLIDALDTAILSNDQMSEIMKEFWIPGEILEQSYDRIRSSSIHDPGPPSSPERNAIYDLNTECGLEIPKIIRAISILNESVETKLEELNGLENTLKEQEKMINRFNTMIQNFRSGLDTLSFEVDISGKNMFLETLNYKMYDTLKHKNIPEKIKRFQYLMSQIRLIRKITNISRRVNDGRLPQCNICYTNEIKSALVPCGHMFCEQCLSNLSNDHKCFTCRKRSSRILRLYPN